MTTLLHMAVENKNTDATLLLIANGADIYAEDDDGYTPIYYWSSDVDIVLLLDPYQRNRHGRTPLHWRCSWS